MPNKNKLSIYLVKENLVNIEDIFDKPNEIAVLDTLTDGSKVYYKASGIHEPSWMRDFFLKNNNNLHQANSRVVLLKNISIDGESRIFALTFGYARFLFKPNVLEEQFGLRIILNTIQQNEIRKISKTSVGTNQKQSDEQLPKNSDISEFGFDINRDLMKNISGKSDDEIFEKSMLTGGDIFSLTVSRDVTNINEFLIYCYKRFKETTYQANFAWIDNIKFVRDQDLITQLNTALINEINNKNFNQVWMAVPEVVSWEDIKDFVISGDKQHYADIEIKKVIESIKKDLTSVDQLQNKTIRAISSRDNNQAIYEWRAYNCIIAEITLDGKEYCLSNGKWYRIDTNFVNTINQQYNNIELNQDSFIEYSHKDEDHYNEDLCSSFPDAILLHKYKVPIGGGQGNNIEPCDVLHGNKMIHIKHNGGSSMLSHLFNQALVSSQMWLDNESRNILKDKLANDGKFDIIPQNFSATNYEIVLGIINKFSDERPKIPFFSKVSLCFAIRNIKHYGYKVSLKNIKNIK
ncbi:MAG: TIGR04141 family sporadically distributed protein [Clostridiales bacterium]|nr:TIGR04141 family sporadically distributed protein [Clostridiales bacterium]